MTYTYPANFGKQDTNQTETDKVILKRLSQVNKEHALPLKSLIKKIKQETQRLLDYANNNQKDSLSFKLQKAQNYPVLLAITPQKEILGKLVSGPYSDLVSRKESTKYTLDLSTSQYREDCTLTPACKDCQVNGPYSTCASRRMVHHKQQIGSIPLSRYWDLALFGRVD